eukprot:g16388.t1
MLRSLKPAPGGRGEFEIHLLEPARPVVAERVQLLQSCLRPMGPPPHMWRPPDLPPPRAPEWAPAPAAPAPAASAPAAPTKTHHRSDWSDTTGFFDNLPADAKLTS